MPCGHMQKIASPQGPIDYVRPGGLVADAKWLGATSLSLPQNESGELSAFKFLKMLLSCLLSSHVSYLQKKKNAKVIISLMLTKEN